MRRLVVAAVVVLGMGGGVAGADVGRARCERGEFCVWAGEGYRGGAQRLSLVTVNPGECVPLARAGRSFVNRMSRMVTVYQGGECSTEGEFDTYPGGGTYVPQAPYVVRAVQVWDGR